MYAAVFYKITVHSDWVCKNIRLVRYITSLLKPATCWRWTCVIGTLYENSDEEERITENDWLSDLLHLFQSVCHTKLYHTALEDWNEFGM